MRSRVGLGWDLMWHTRRSFMGLQASASSWPCLTLGPSELYLSGHVP